MLKVRTYFFEQTKVVRQAERICVILEVDRLRELYAQNGEPFPEGEALDLQLLEYAQTVALMENTSEYAEYYNLGTLEQGTLETGPLQVRRVSDAQNGDE